ncbi:MAG: hypothetical protein U1E54_01295 [Candidatus Levybacteria bacterium]|nr:hypothetical protein [Candidatus Levybacteria bacterium]
MENKTTTELIDLLNNLSEEKGDFKEGGKYEKILGELKDREPFLQILGEDWDTSLPAVWKAIEEIQKDIKLLKRHKHEEKSGDVMIRI